MTPDDALGVARELQLHQGERMDVMFHGTSMDPLLYEGDTVIVEPASLADLRIGDIVTYRKADKYPTRRLVQIRDDRLRLWCDAWPKERFFARPDDVLGVAVARIRNDRRLDATAPEWTIRRDRALRTYRRYRPLLEWRRLMWRLRAETRRRPTP